MPLTNRLEAMDEDESSDMEEEESNTKPGVPDLDDLFQVGQYVRARVLAVHAPGSSASITGLENTRDQVVKASKRVELTLVPEKVNEGVQKGDLKSGFVSDKFIPSHLGC